MLRTSKKSVKGAKKTAPAKKSVRKPALRRSTKKPAVKKAARKTRGAVKIRKAAVPQKIRLKYPALHLAKFPGNPIIVPSDRPWESRATFNPAAIHEDGSVHLLYRAIGESDVSVLGYAASHNGLHVDTQLDMPAYAPREPFAGMMSKPAGTISWATYNSGGGTCGGCEDPRLTRIGDRIYMTYTDYDGWSAPRVAITSIKRDDFIHHIWNWRPPVIISTPKEAHKNWVIFPEKINGKYAILHGISPSILIDYFDSLDFDGTTFIPSTYKNVRYTDRWDSSARGVGPPPIKTKDGWLVFYHAISAQDPGKYKLGAMLLDLADPRKVLCRATEPLLEPSEYYENNGFKAGVVYSCGAVIKDGELLLYYGGSDSVVCVATAPLDAFLKELKRSGTPKIKPRTTSSVSPHVPR